MRIISRSVFAALAASLSLAACGGGGGSSPSPHVATVPATPAPSSAPAASGGSANVTFKMNWQSGAVSVTNSTARRPASLASTARSASIVVNTAVPQIINSPTSSLSFIAPAGLDTFFIKVYDEQNGQGNVLGQAAITQNVSASQTGTVISSTINGTIASLQLSIPTNLNAGQTASTALAVAAFDADGNVIVGPADYNTAITLVTSDSANAPLSAYAYQTPGQTPISINYSGNTLAAATITANAGPGVTPVSVSFAPVPTIYEYSVPGSPQYIAHGTGAGMWYTDNNNTVVKIKAGGAYTAYTIPSANAYPLGITLGENGNMWFAEYSTSKIAEVTNAGTITEFGTLFSSDSPLLVMDRGDGNIWYTGYGGNHIGYVNVSNGTAGETTFPTANSAPWGIAEGPDGNIYVTENGRNDLARIANLFGTITETAVTANSSSESIVQGPDGNMWFTQPGLSHIGVISPGYFAQTASYPTTPSAYPADIAVGADGNLWFTETGLDRIGRMTTGGVQIGDFRTPTTSTGLKGIAVSSDGSVWFCEPYTFKVGRLVY